MSGQNEPDVKAFLRDLRKISKKHGMAIGGSGDLGSPWIADIKSRRVLTTHFHCCPTHDLHGDYEEHRECR